MSIQIKPHSVTVGATTQTPGSNSVLENPVVAAPGAPIACLCTPLKPSESFHRFGVVLKDAWIVYLDLADSSGFLPLAEVVFNSQTYYVQGHVEIHQNGDDADCAVVYMTRLQYQ